MYFNGIKSLTIVNMNILRFYTAQMKIKLPLPGTVIKRHINFERSIERIYLQCYQEYFIVRLRFDFIQVYPMLAVYFNLLLKFS